MDTKIIGITILAIISMVGTVIAAPMFGAGNLRWTAQDLTDEQKGEIVQARESFRSAILENDYAKALELHNKYGFMGDAFELLDETSFARLSDAKNKLKEAKTIMKELKNELGLPTEKGFGKGQTFKIRGLNLRQGECPFLQDESTAIQ